MSRARTLANRANQNTLAVETSSNEVGVSSASPRSTLDVRGEVRVGTAIQAGVAGVITATSFSADSYESSTGGISADSLTIAGISTIVRLAVTNEVVTGIITALGLSGNLTGAAATLTGALSGNTGTFSGAVNVDATTDSTSTTTGALIVDGGAAIAKNVYIGAGLSVAGTLTYEDVTSVDSVGMVTAKSGVNVSGGELNVGLGFSVGNAGVCTASNFVGSLTGNVAGNASSASEATTVTVTANESGDELLYLAMVDGTSSTQNIEADSSLQYNPSKGEIKVGVAFSVGAAGIVTAAGFVGGTISGTTGTFSGAVSGSTGTFTGDVDIADKIVHTGDTNTAIRFPDVDTVSIETAGVEGMRIGGSNGIVGIGTNKTSGSGARLRIGTNLLSLTQDMSDGGCTVVPRTGDTIATAQVMPLITAAGEGSSPHILRAGIAVESISGRSGMDLLFLTRYAADGTALDVTDDEKMRITSGNRVGIGTTAPAATLHIEGTETGLWVERNLQTLKLDANYGNGGDEAILASAGLRLYSGGTNERVRVHSGGTFEFKTGPLTEKVEITAGKLSDNNDIDLADGMVHYFTTAETTTCTPNIRVDGSTTLNSVMNAGDAISVTLITTAAAAGYCANFSIDGNGVTEEWVGGSAPSAGGSNGLDIYSLTIICTHNTNTGDSGFKVIVNVSNAT